MSTWLLPAALGALIGIGLYLLVSRVVPARPDPDAVMARLTGTDRPVVIVTESDADARVRTGAWLQRRVPVAELSRIVPDRADLDIVGRDLTSVLGEKVLCAAAALVLGPVLTLLTVVAGLPFSPALPLGGALVVTVGAFFAPDLQVRVTASRARAEFARAVTSYLELIAIDRISGAGATQATEGAAKVARSWPFRRIVEALDTARWAGVSAWQGLDDLADQVGVPELHDVAQIMRQAGNEDSAVYDQLRARARSLRSTQLALEQQRAAEESNRMTFPVTATAFVFMGMLLFPLLVRTMT